MHAILPKYPTKIACNFNWVTYHFAPLSIFDAILVEKNLNLLWIGLNKIYICYHLSYFYSISNVFDWAPLPHRGRPWTWPWPSRDNPETVCINHLWSLDASQVTVTVTVSHGVVTEPSQNRWKYWIISGVLVICKICV